MQLSGRNDENVAGADRGLDTVDIRRVGIYIRHDDLDRGMPVCRVVFVLNVMVNADPAERGHYVFTRVASGEGIAGFVDVQNVHRCHGGLPY